MHWSQQYGWNAKIALGKGDGTFEKAKTSKPSGGHGGAYTQGSGDFNGDGVTDLSLVHWSSQYGWSVKMALNRASSPKLTSFANPGTESTTVQYGVMTDSSVYTKHDDSAYPVRDLQYPKPMVSGVNRPNGIGDYQETRYRYAGLKYDLRLRQSLGFASMATENVDTGIKITSKFNQTYPFSGFKKYEKSELASGQILSEIVVSGFDKFETVPGHQIWFPFSTTRKETSFLRKSNLAPAGEKSVRTINRFNYSGQVIQSTVETTGDDGLGTFIVKTVNTYQNQYSKRRQGEIVSAAVTSSSPSGSTIARTSAFEYDWSTGKLVKEIIEPNNSDPSIRRVTKYGYDSFGNRISTVTCNGNHISDCSEQTPDSRFSILEYDNKGLFAVKATNALGHTITTEYEPRYGKAVKVTDANGLTASSKIDSFGRTKETVSPLGISTFTTRSWCRSACGVRVGGLSAYYKIAVSGAGKSESVTFYDQQNRAIRKQSEGLNGEVIWTDTEYDSLGRVKRTSEPYFQGNPVYWNTPTYDLLSRKISVTTPNQDGSYDYSSRIEYNGFSTTITDGLGRTLTEEKDVTGNVVKMIDKIGDITRYTYDALGKMTQSIDPAGNLINLTYDQRGRKVRLDDPDMGVWTYEYDTFDALVAQIDAKGQRTEVAYDRLGRKVARTDLAGTTDEKTSAWEYDTAVGAGVGKLKQVDAPDGSSFTNFRYDSMGRVSQRVQVIAGKTFRSNMSYNSLGQLVRVSYPETTAYPEGFAVSRSYNSRGYLKAVSSADGSQTFWSADAVSARGQLESVTLGNGLVDLNAHSQANGWLIAQQTLGEDVALRDATYHFDTVGNVKQRKDEVQGLSEMFEYDGLDRLTDAYIVGGAGYPAKAYVYDALGNIVNKSDVGAYSYSGCGGRPHAVCSAGGTDYTYDANGSMLSARSASSDTQVRYTAFNKANFMQKGNHAITFEYDGDRRRHYRSQLYGGSLRLKTYYVGTTGEGGKLFEREVGSSGTKDIHYIYGAGGQAVATHISQGTKAETNYLHRDHLGSVILVTDDLGKVVNNTISYDAWGKRRNSNWSDAGSAENLEKVVGNIGFTGQESVPEIGLTHMNGRIYDSTLGRFLGADPLIQAPYNSQSFNRYAYVMNNPLGLVDPSGYSWLSNKWGKVKRAASKINGWKKSLTNAMLKAYQQIRTFDPITRYTDVALKRNKGLRYIGQVAAGVADVMGCGGSCSAIYSAHVAQLMGAGVTGMTAAGISGYAMGNVAIGGAEAFNQGVMASVQWAGSTYINGQVSNSVTSYLSRHTGLSTKDIMFVDAGLRVLGSKNSTVSFAGKVWNAPNSAVGLVWGGLGHGLGMALGTNPSVGIDNNGIEFKNNFLMGSAMTLGNVIIYGVDNGPSNANRHFWNTPESYTVGREEGFHTLQGEILGPAYFLMHVVGGLSSMARSSHSGLIHEVDPWHQNNFMETGPMQGRVF